MKRQKVIVFNNLQEAIVELCLSDKRSTECPYTWLVFLLFFFSFFSVFGYRFRDMTITPAYRFPPAKGVHRLKNYVALGMI
jgi:hypothetical protein